MTNPPIVSLDTPLKDRTCRWATYSQQAKNSRHPVRNRNEKGQYA